jgi:hypothetical protein
MVADSHRRKPLPRHGWLTLDNPLSPGQIGGCTSTTIWPDMAELAG